jgi:LPXTG-motif cell wall-anchored protein
LTAETEPEVADKPSGSSLNASPTVASILAGIAAVMWAQTVIRYLAANMTLEFWNLILPEKTADVVAIWLASVVIGLVVLAAAYLLFRKRKRVGSVRVWIAILLVSAILRYL